MKSYIETFTFVLCPRFHGATTLALLLNNHSKISSLGDTAPGTAYDQTCGCTAKVSKCVFWQHVDERFGQFRVPGFSRLYPRVPIVLRDERLNRLVVRYMSIAAVIGGSFIWAHPAGRKYMNFYRSFIDTVNEYNCTSVYVSGAKQISAVLAIRGILGRKSEIKIIHLIRDPRGFFASERRVEKVGLERSAKIWRQYHGRVKKVASVCHARLHEVRYEDLCSNPKDTMRNLFEFIGVENEDVFFPPKTHHMMGNASMHRFDGQLVESKKWLEMLTPDEQVQCLKLAQPLSSAYGYFADAANIADVDDQSR